MKVLILVHQDLVPPDHFETKEKWETSDCKTEFDVVKGLKEGGNKIMVLGVSDELKPIREAIEAFRPRIVFNLLEEFAGEAVYDQNVVSYLELLGVKYTGCGPRGLMICRDKALAKKILTYHRVPNPKFYVFKNKTRSPHLPKSIRYPLFVKSLVEEASLGITQDSIVANKEQLLERIQHFREKIDTEVIAEDYIEGRELYVGIVGNSKLQVFPPRELFFNKTSDRVPKIATSKVKWDFKYRKKYGITTGPAKDLSGELSQKIEKVCKRAYRTLGLKGYARIDLRINEKDEVFIIEVNPNPDIGFHEDLSDSALSMGIKYPELLEKIMRLGLS